MKSDDVKPKSIQENDKYGFSAFFYQPADMLKVLSSRSIVADASTTEGLQPNILSLSKIQNRTHKLYNVQEQQRIDEVMQGSSDEETRST